MVVLDTVKLDDEWKLFLSGLELEISTEVWVEYL